MARRRGPALRNVREQLLADEREAVACYPHLWPRVFLHRLTAGELVEVHGFQVDGWPRPYDRLRVDVEGMVTVVEAAESSGRPA